MSYFQDVYSVLSAHKLNFEQTQRNGKCHFETFVMFEGGNRQEIHGRKIPKLLSVFFLFFKLYHSKNKTSLILKPQETTVYNPPKWNQLEKMSLQIFRGMSRGI